jgi:hypothetical protein
MVHIEPLVEQQLRAEGDSEANGNAGLSTGLRLPETACAAYRILFVQSDIRHYVCVNFPGTDDD